MIELRDVTKIFPASGGQDEIPAVDLVSFTVAEHETLCLIGTSGSGKTTVMKMINRLIDPTRGDILLDGQNVRDFDEITLRRRVGYVIQSAGLFPHLTVARNIGLLCGLEGWKKSRTQARVHELLDLVGLPPEEFAHRHPRELSGGQRQRVGVARALALDPATILMDEPFGALDPITRAQLHTEFRDLQAKVGKTVILVTHDMAEAFDLGDRIALMDGGRLVQIGTESELRENPASDFVTQFIQNQAPAAKLPPKP